MNIKHIYRKLVINFINSCLCGMHFFKLKRKLLNSVSGINIGDATRIVGPFWAGTVSEITIGSDTFINRNFSVEGNGKLIIGDNVDLGPAVRILTGGHKIGDNKHRAGEGVLYSIEIKNGTWVGAETTVLGNTIIGEGCVVGAKTLVNKNTPSNVLIVGHPGRVKRYLENEVME